MDYHVQIHIHKHTIQELSVISGKIQWERVECADQLQEKRKDKKAISFFVPYNLISLIGLG